MEVDKVLKRSRAIKKDIRRLESSFCGNRELDKITDLRIRGLVFERMYLLNKITNMLRRLPVSQSRVLFMYYVKGYSLKEIANIEKMSSMWVRKQLHIGECRLKNLVA